MLLQRSKEKEMTLSSKERTKAKNLAQEKADKSTAQVRWVGWHLLCLGGHDAAHSNSDLELVNPG